MMKVEILGGIIKYTATTSDWIAFIEAKENKVTIEFESNFGTMKLNSGVNYDNLVTFINDVKADAISKGVNWSGN